MVVVAITDFGRADLDQHVRAYDALRRTYVDGQLAIQVRIPGAPQDEVRRCAVRLQELSLPLFVNGHPELARELGAGLHLGSRSKWLAEAEIMRGNPGLLSVACHTEEELAVARALGAAFAIVSPVFDVPGKGPALGLGGLRRLILAAGELPVVALGGIDDTNWHQCREVGAAGFAGIRAFLGKRG